MHHLLPMNSFMHIHALLSSYDSGYEQFCAFYAILCRIYAYFMHFMQSYAILCSSCRFYAFYAVIMQFTCSFYADLMHI